MVKERLNLPDNDTNRKQDYWVRIELPGINTLIDVSDLKIGSTKTIKMYEGLEIRVLAHRVMKDGAKIVTITMTNTNSKGLEKRLESEKAFFQPELVIEEEEKGSIVDLAYNVGLSTDEEVLELNMLYHDVKNYASGHGCAVEVVDEKGKKRISSRFLPEYEVRQMKPSTTFSGEILSMKYLSEASAEEVTEGLA